MDVKKKKEVEVKHREAKEVRKQERGTSMSATYLPRMHFTSGAKEEGMDGKTQRMRSQKGAQIRPTPQPNHPLCDVLQDQKRRGWVVNHNESSP